MPLRFTRAWEDDRLDIELLRVAPGERVLVVAAAGDTALALAAEGAAVTAVDRDPDQLRLVRLKLAAAQVLRPETLHRWFEVGRDPAAPAVYRGWVRERLSADDAAWWDERIGMLERGLHTAAGVGGPFLVLGRTLRALRPGLVAEIEHVPDAAAQAEWWRRSVRPLVDNRLTRALASGTPVLSALAPNAAEVERIRRSGWLHGLADRIDGVVATVLVRRHPWWRPAFSGRPVDPGDGAAWLDADRAGSLAAAPVPLVLVESDLEAALRTLPAGSLAAASLSNVPDWIDARATASLAAAVCRALAPGGRVLVRRMADPGADAFEAAGLTRDPLSVTLPGRDRTALYERVDLYRQ
jgi:S-adenosylmethionine:diacylglycerol 3-amino-3-carboxypropyl transferase